MERMKILCILLGKLRNYDEIEDYFYLKDGQLQGLQRVAEGCR